MKHLIFFTWAVIITVMWFIFMIIGFVFRSIWDFNPKNYKFNYNPYHVNRSEPHAACSPYSNNDQSDYKNSDYNYRTYFHYIWNIKPRNYEV